MTDPERGDQAQPVAVKIDWSDVAAAAVHHVNQVMGQVGPATAGVPDGIYLTLASVFPPPITSTEVQARFVEQLQATGLQAVAAGRFHMTRELAEEVVNVLRFAIEQYDAAVKHAGRQAEGRGDAAS